MSDPSSTSPQSPQSTSSPNTRSSLSSYSSSSSASLSSLSSSSSSSTPSDETSAQVQQPSTSHNQQQNDTQFSRTPVSQVGAEGAQQAQQQPNSTKSFFARALRRRKIRTKLDEIAKVISSPQIDHLNRDQMTLFSEADCALLTSQGEIILSTSINKHTTTTTTLRNSNKLLRTHKTIELIKPKIKLLRSTSDSLISYLSIPAKNNLYESIHIRGYKNIIHSYRLSNNHILIAITELITTTSDDQRKQQQYNNLDSIIEKVDKALGIQTHGHTLIKQLDNMLLEF